MMINIRILILTFQIVHIFSAVQLNVTPSLGYTTAVSQNINILSDYSSNWAFYNYIDSANNVYFRVIQNGTLSPNIITIPNNILSLAVRIQGHPANTVTNSRYFIIDCSNILKAYYSSALTLTYMSVSQVNDATFTLNNTSIAGISSSTKSIFMLDLALNTIKANQSLGSITPLQISYKNGTIIVYSQDNVNSTQAFFSFFSQNLTYVANYSCVFAPLVTFNLAGGSATFKINHTFYFQPTQNYLIRSYSSIVQVINVTSRLPVFSTKYTIKVYEAQKCLDFLIVLGNGTIYFYQYLTWTSVLNYTISTSLYGFMKCLSDISAIGLNFVTLPGDNITFFHLNYTVPMPINVINSTNTINNVSNTNNTLNLINTTNNTQANNNTYTINSLNNSNQILNKSTSSQDEYFDIVQNILNNKQFKTTMHAAIQVTGVLGASSLGTSFVRPLANLFEELMLYKYHTHVYPEVVEAVINQFDILAFLRLKPSFMNFKITDVKSSSLNQHYQNYSPFLSSRSPDPIFFIQFLQNVYLFNFIMGITMFIVFVIAKKMVSYAGIRIAIINHILNARTLWWNLLVLTFSLNIRIIVFFISIQLKLSFSIDFYSKFNMILTFCSLFIIILYSLTFHFLLYRYQLKKYSCSILQIGKYSLKSFALQMQFQYIRSFLQGFINGYFTNQYHIQLCLLIIIDCATVAFLLIFRKEFNSMIIFALSIAYQLAFIIFNICILLEVFNFNFSFNLCFMILIGILSAIVISKMLFIFIYEVFVLFKKSCYSRKINQLQYNITNNTTNNNKIEKKHKNKRNLLKIRVQNIDLFPQIQKVNHKIRISACSPVFNKVQEPKIQNKIRFNKINDKFQQNYQPSMGIKQKQDKVLQVDQQISKKRYHKVRVVRRDSSLRPQY